MQCAAVSTMFCASTTPLQRPFLLGDQHRVALDGAVGDIGADQRMRVIDARRSGLRREGAAAIGGIVHCIGASPYRADQFNTRFSPGLSSENVGTSISNCSPPSVTI